MLSLYEILKASKTGIAPDMWTALAGANWSGAGSGAETKELTGIPPLSFTANGQPLLDYLISGNMSQTGTPTPSSPIQPQETGERTANLLFKKIPNANISSDGKIVVYSSGYDYAVYVAEVEEGKTYTTGNGFSQAYALYTSEPNVNSISYNGSRSVIGTSIQNITIPTGNDIKYIALRWTSTFEQAMFNEGTTPLPYEPYGYKLDIKSANTTTPVYLGEVQSTRRIKKLVFDGTESWNEGTSNYYIFINVSGRGEGIPNSTALSTHTESGVVVNNNGTALFFKKSVFVHSSLADFKTYLQQQYAAGTPVTIWYVLATEETTVVNEPLRKIGDYADTVSYEQAGVQIPTLLGNTVIDVETELKPSEMYIKYKG